MDNPLRVGLAQFPISVDTRQVVKQAHDELCQILVFPEMFSNGYQSFNPAVAGSKEAWIDRAESIDGRYVSTFRELAMEFRLAIVATFLERATPEPFNSAVLIDASGNIVLRQRKIHTCFFENPEAICGAGVTSETVVLPTSCGNVTTGIMICMDREYPDVLQSLVSQQAELVLVPNACQLNDDRDVGDVRIAGIRSRAFESVTAIAVANYPAPDHDGHSTAVDAQGRIIAQGGRSPGLIVANYDVPAIRRLQRTEWFRRTGVNATGLSAGSGA